MSAVIEPLVETTNGRDAVMEAIEPRGNWRQRREELLSHGFSWPVIFWLAIIHLGVLAAPFCFSWSGLGLMFVLHWLTGGMGICLGFHRLLTHDSFKTNRPVKYLLAIVGGLAGEGSCIQWVANHRKHHAFSDENGDPHSPRDGGWWSHVIWTAARKPAQEMEEHIQRWAPKLAADRGLIWIDRAFLLSHFVAALAIGAAGYGFGGWGLAVSWVVWGMFLRLAFVLHSTWLVNSASHLWGYRNYETRDDSRNNWWVALFTYGEGWHNNHHAYPRMANHGHRWWEVDVTFTTIRLMKVFGLAWDVIDYKRKEMQTG